MHNHMQGPNTLVVISPRDTAQIPILRLGQNIVGLSLSPFNCEIRLAFADCTLYNICYVTSFGSTGRSKSESPCMTQNPSAIPTPSDLLITPRDMRFDRGELNERWWLGNAPIATAFYNALSATFPRGEAFFVDSVRAFRNDVPEKLAREIRAFTKQEVIHSREHLAFNKRLAAAGYDLSRLEQDIIDEIGDPSAFPPIVNLAGTMAMEHFTAIMAKELLTNPRHLENADRDAQEMWRWHVVEEIEHKGVAYDTYLVATAAMSRPKRWALKSAIMIQVSWVFWKLRYRGMLDLLRQDGLSGMSVHFRILWFLVGSPGILRRLLPAWLSFFLPGFHPWNHDDRELIRAFDSEYEAARPVVSA